MIESDIYPSGLGFFLYRRAHGSDAWEVFYAVSLVGMFELRNDSRYQNSIEFLGIVMALVTLRWLGVTEAVVDILGDNTASWLALLILMLTPLCQ